jgi:Flp pilus assembly protein TadG
MAQQTLLALLARFRNQLRAFHAADSGNIVFTFALALVPMVGFVGAAVDYSRANSARTAMQAAVDSTALMLSKEAGNLSTSQINQKATAYFNALFNRTEVSNILITPTYTTSGGSQIVVTGTGTVAATFMKVLGRTQINIDVSSTVKWGNSRLRVALVLDNTGSMADANKMPNLKTAAKNLLTQLKNAAGQNGDVYVSIIPFAEDVNVDPVNYNQSWIRWDLWDAANGTCSQSSYANKSSCQGNGKTWTPKNHNTWNGCVTDRDQNYDTTNTPPASGNQATLFPAEQYGFSFFGTFWDACPVPLMALSYDWTALNNKIDAMQPNGFTNQAIGLQWGFQSLTSAPFTIPAKDPNYTYQDVIVLFTDGLNTSDRWYPYGNSTSEASIDARQLVTCNNVKAAGITIYAIQITTEGDPQSALLKSCASGTSKFFFLTSASDLITVFNQIGTNLSELRISK